MRKYATVPPSTTGWVEATSHWSQSGDHPSHMFTIPARRSEQRHWIFVFQRRCRIDLMWYISWTFVCVHWETVFYDWKPFVLQFCWGWLEEVSHNESTLTLWFPHQEVRDCLVSWWLSSSPRHTPVTCFTTVENAHGTWHTWIVRWVNDSYIKTS